MSCEVDPNPGYQTYDICIARALALGSKTIDRKVEVRNVHLERKHGPQGP